MSLLTCLRLKGLIASFLSKKKRLKRVSKQGKSVKLEDRQKSYEIAPIHDSSATSITVECVHGQQSRWSYCFMSSFCSFWVFFLFPSSGEVVWLIPRGLHTTYVQKKTNWLKNDKLLRALLQPKDQGSPVGVWSSFAPSTSTNRDRFPAGSVQGINEEI